MISENKFISKDIINLKKIEPKQSLLQIVCKNKKKEKDNKEIEKNSSINPSQEPLKNKTFSNLNSFFKKKTITKTLNEKNKLSKRNIKKNLCLLNQFKQKKDEFNSSISEDNDNNIININNNSKYGKIKKIEGIRKDQYNMRGINDTKEKNYSKSNEKFNIAKNRLLFPTINKNEQFNSGKKEKDDSSSIKSTFCDNYNKNYLTNSFRNFNNNNLVFDESNTKYGSIFQNFKGDKSKIHKNSESNLIKRSNNKRKTISKFISHKMFPNFEFKAENANKYFIKKKNLKNYIRSDSRNLSLSLKRNELNTKKNKIKGVNFINKDKNENNNIDRLKTIETYSEIKKTKNNYTNILPNTTVKNNKIPLCLDTESLSVSTRARDKINAIKVLNKNDQSKNKSRENLININNSYFENKFKSNFNTIKEKNDKNSSIESSDKKFRRNNIKSSKDLNQEEKNIIGMVNYIVNNNLDLINQKKEGKFNLKKRNVYKRKATVNFTGADIIILKSKESIYNNFLFNRDEESYFKEKRLKLIEKVEKFNKSSYLYSSYNEEIKNNLLKYYSINKIVDRIFFNFIPMKNKLMNKKIREKKIKKTFNEIFNEILNKSQKFYYLYKILLKYIKSLSKIKNIQRKIERNYILELFDIYQEQIKHYAYISVSKSIKEYNYLKKLTYFESKYNKIYESFEIIKYNRYLIGGSPNFNIDTKVNEINKYKKSKLKVNNNKSKNLNKKINLENQEISSINNDQNKINDLDLSLDNISSVHQSINKNMDFKTCSKKELVITKKKESFEKFTKLYNLYQPKGSAKLIEIIKKKEEKNKKPENLKKNKQSLFNIINYDMDNYNVLKNRNIFDYNNNNKVSLENFISSLVNLKGKIKEDRKSKIDSMNISLMGFDHLSKEACLLKTHEMEKDLPEVQLFNKIIQIFESRNLTDCNYLNDLDDNIFKKIINKQEFLTGNTLLMYATQNNLKSMVELLLLKGADPNIKNKFGNSPLHMAYKNDNPFIISLLLEYGANEKLKNYNGFLPWQMRK